MKILLTGFMGSGKSTVAPIIAKKLESPLVELDSLILKSAEVQSVSEIFKNFGEDYFRALETACLESALLEENIVISGGGGVLFSNNNLEVLKKADIFLVYLETSFDVLSKRLASNNLVKDRPLFQDKEKARELYDSRLPIYEEAANLKVTTDELSPSLVAERIIKNLNC